MSSDIDKLKKAEARIKELEAEDWCRTAIIYQYRIKDLEDLVVELERGRDE